MNEGAENSSKGRFASQSSGQHSHPPAKASSSPRHKQHSAHPGPADHLPHDIRAEVRRVSVWLSMAGAAALLVMLIHPLLLIIAAIVIATMLDGGSRLLGRVLPVARPIRLLLVILAVFAFLIWTFYLTGVELAAQAAQLPALIEAQADRASVWMAQQGINPGMTDLRSAVQQLMGSMGRVTAALGSVIGLVTSLVMILVLAIFLAVEPRIYARGAAWLLPMDHRDGALALLARMGSTLRRLMAGRLLGMAVEGAGTWLLLLAGGVPMAALLGMLTGILAFLPNIGAIVSGMLIILVGFSAGTGIGIYAISVYLAVQMVDGYLIVPAVARRTVDLAPALVLGAQILMGTLFGLLGLFLADPMVAMAKVWLEETARRRNDRQAGRILPEPATIKG